jgi:hypothetical protein
MAYNNLIKIMPIREGSAKLWFKTQEEIVIILKLRAERV